MKNNYSIASIKKVKWGVLEENNPISLYPVMYPGWSGIIETIKSVLGKSQKNIICIHRKKLGIIFVDHREWTSLGKHALKRILKNPEWGLTIDKKIHRLSDELVSFVSSKISKVDLKKKTGMELHGLYKGYDIRHTKLYIHSIVPVYLDLYKPHLTTYLTEYLRKQVSRFKYNRTAKECFTLLTVPEKLSKVQKEEVSLLKIAAFIKIRHKGRMPVKRKLTPALTKRIERHMEEFRYLGYNFEGPAFPDSYFYQRLKEMVRDDIGPQRKIKRIFREKREARGIEKQIIRDLKVDNKHQKLLELAKRFIFSKDYRKMSLVQAYYQIEPLLMEIGRRTHLSLGEVRNTLLQEIEQILANKIVRPKELSQRMKGCLYIVVNKDLPGRVLVDNRFNVMKKYLLKREDLTEVNYFHGQAAYLGEARGRVKIINSKKDLTKMKKGNIMVSQMTNPDLVPAMKKAAAIITDLGGVTCHAAIISRELKIPCVIGTKVATKVLKDGEEVEVDANQGDIRKI